jgi:hypothetical protein
MTQRPPLLLRFLKAWTVLIGLVCVARGTEPPLAVPATPLSAPGFPPACKEHLYIFLVNGLDPFDCAGLAGLGKHLEEQGFCNSYYGSLLHSHAFRDQIRCIHQADPDAHFILIGFSLGANKVCGLAESLEKDGAVIDVVIFLSGNHWVGGLVKNRPRNVCRIINIRASGCLVHTGVRDWAEDYLLSDAWHFGTPRHAATRALLDDILSGGQ